jgi:hypothetical protein
MTLFTKSKSLLIILIFSWINNTNAQSSYEHLQAVYLYNFAKYIKWPNETPTFVFGLIGETELYEQLQNTLKGKKVAGKEIEIKIIKKLDESLNCNVVMGRNILIVTEDDLIKKGAMISFVVNNDRLAFKLKTLNLSRAGLKASEGLLKLAILL